MGLINILTLPIRKVWKSIHRQSNDRNHRKGSNQGITILYEEVKFCHYQDVQVMWSLIIGNRDNPALTESLIQN
ncbi:hypothetical protein SUGI_0211640 [Cryptomeria japonica]|nr:hypothetical protein SUGI_0211640 [Cryptomeria japonica]